MGKLDCFFIGVIVGTIATAIISSTIVIPPEAVYQGKTTLKYEVVDGVKVDSIVVWKEEFKNK